MSLASQIGILGLQWAAGTFLIAGVLNGTRGALRIGGYIVPFIHGPRGQKVPIILLAVSAALALAAVSWHHLAT